MIPQSKIFLNLPVANLQASMDFYTRIGFRNEPMFTDETAAGMQFSNEIFVMLLTHDKYRSFQSKPIADSHTHGGTLFALQVPDTDAMNQMFEAAIEAGGQAAGEARDYGFMQQRGFEDPDGHTWSVFFMDIAKFPQPQTAEHA